MDSEKRGRGRPRVPADCVRINIRLRGQTLRDLDTVCAFSGKSRSEIIDTLLSANYEALMDGIGKQPGLFAILQQHPDGIEEEPETVACVLLDKMEDEHSNLA